MARIAGVDIPNDKQVDIALRYIYGIGRHAGQQDPRQSQGRAATSVRDLTDDEINRIREVIDRDYMVEGDLRGGAPEHPAPDRDQLLSRHPAPPRPARARPADPHQRPHQAGRPPHRGRQEAGDRQEVSSRTRSRMAEKKTRRRRSAKTGTEVRPEGQGLHPVHLQQHAHHADRPQRATSSPGAAPAPPASRARARARPTPPRWRPRQAARKAMDQGMRQVDVFVKGPGSGREAAIRALQAAGPRRPQHPRRDAHTAQRLPPAQAAPGLAESEGRSR